MDRRIVLHLQRILSGQTCPIFYKLKSATDIHPDLESVLQGQSVQEQRKVDYDEEIRNVREAAKISDKELEAERAAIKGEEEAPEVSDLLDALIKAEETPVKYQPTSGMV